MLSVFNLHLILVFFTGLGLFAVVAVFLRLRIGTFFGICALMTFAFVVAKTLAVIFY